MTSTLTERVAGEIRAEIARQRTSGRQIALQIGKPVTTVNRWLNSTTPLSIEDLDVLAKALAVRADDLVARANGRYSDDRNSGLAQATLPNLAPELFVISGGNEPSEYEPAKLALVG